MTKYTSNLFLSKAVFITVRHYHTCKLNYIKLKFNWQLFSNIFVFYTSHLSKEYQTLKIFHFAYGEHILSDFHTVPRVSSIVNSNS